MSHRTNFTSTLTWLALLAAATLAACADEETVAEPAPPTATPATRACDAMQAYLTQCGAATPCDEALAADCADVVSIMSDAYLSAVAACIEADQAPLACMQSSVSALTPSASHHALAAQFCSECALGVPGCEEAFYAPDGSTDEPRLGALLLPFGDDVVAAVAAECASGLTCATTFLSCAQGVLAQRALPEQSLQCMIDSFTDPDASPPEAGDCGSPAPTGCNVLGRWQMQETLVDTNCTSAPAGLPFILDIAESPEGHTIMVNYDKGYTCAGSIEVGQCTANFTCPFVVGTGNFTITFDDVQASGTEQYDASGCSSGYTVSGDMIP